MWETAISLLSNVNTVNEFAQNVCSIFKKDKSSQHFEQVVAHLGGIKTGIERLSEKILYAPNLQAVQDVQRTQQQIVGDLRTVRERLEPVQHAVGSELLASAMILTPEKMQQALAKNPWEVLCDVRPVHFFETKNMPPEAVPVLFEQQGVRYMGWQLRGTLPILFNCRYENMWLPESTQRVPQIITPPTELSIPNADFIVAPGGKYPTITAALHQAKGGERIVVKTGLYRENLVLDKTVELIAAGAVVIESSEHCILMQTDYAVVRGFTLHCLATPADKEVAIYIPQGKLIVDQCEVTSNSLSCVEVCGRGTQTIVRECKLHDSQGGSGIYIYNEATAQIEDCDIFGNALAGVAITTGGIPTLRRCKIHDGKSAGVLVYENGTGQLEDCDIFGNANAGVTIETGGNPTLRRCKIRDGKQSGVYVYENGTGQIEDCDIFGNEHAGVGITTGGNPTLRRCKIHDGKASGVFVYENGTGQLEDCDIFGNANAGVAISEGGNPTLRRCKIHAGKSVGVWVLENGTGQIEDCDIFGNANAGVTIETGGNPTLRRCKIRDGKQSGVYVYENGTGQIEDCDIFGNALTGVAISEGGIPTLRRCTIKNNAYQAFYVHDKGRGTIEDCDLRDNKRGAWDIDSTSQVQRNRNKE